MGINRHKQLTFLDYLAFYHDRRADNLTVSQLQQVLYIHGIQKRHLPYKDEIMDAVHSLVLMPATRSTINSDIVQPRRDSAKSAEYLEEAKQDIRDLGWKECPIGSIMVVPDKSTPSPVKGKRKRKKTRKRKIKDMKHDSPSSLAEKGAANGAKESAYFRCKKPFCHMMKYVDHDPNNPSMCIVTYKGEHNHAIS